MALLDEAGRSCLARREAAADIGLVGLGRWGRNYARVAAAAGARLVVCHTRSRGADVQQVLAEQPGMVHVADVDALLAHDVVAVVVAGPRDSHATVATKVLQRSTHVLVEKPTAVGRAVVAELHRSAEANGVLLRTGYTILHDDAFREFRRICAENGADSWDWRWSKELRGYDCVEIVWEFFPHVLAVLRAVHGADLDAAVERAEVVAQAGPDRTGTVRLVLRDLPNGPTSVEVSTVPCRERKKVIRGFRGLNPVAEWNDRMAWDRLGGRRFRADREPLVGQLSGFLGDTATPDDVRAGEQELDVTVAGMLERLAFTVATQQ